MARHFSDEEVEAMRENHGVPRHFSDEEVEAMRAPELPSGPKGHWIDLAQKSSEDPLGSFSKNNIGNIAESAIREAPALGMMAGGTAGGMGMLGTIAGTGMLGAAGLGAAAIPGMLGAAAGGAAGSTVKNLYSHYVHPELAPQDHLGYVTEPIKHAAEGLMYETIPHAVAPLGLSKVGKYIKKKIGEGGAKIGELISGAPAQDVHTYGTQREAVRDALKKSDRSHAQLADNTRQGYQNSISDTRKTLNDTISKTLENTPSKMIDVSPITSKLEQIKAKIDPINKDEIAGIEDLIKEIKDTATNGQIEVKRLGGITDYLQQLGIYGTTAAGKVLGSKTQQAATSAAREARLLRNQHLPEVAELYRRLETMNKLGKPKNKNLFQPENPDGAFYAAGSGQNPRGEKSLRVMGKATGKDFLNDAKVASAARTFESPGLSPVDKTGKSLYRLAMALPVIGKFAGAITSPAAVKLAIDTGHLFTPEFLMAAVGKVADFTAENYKQIYEIYKVAEQQAESEEKSRSTFDHIKKRKQK